MIEDITAVKATTLQKFMDRTYDEFSNCRVKVVAFPMPPSPVEKLLFMPDSFHDKSYGEIESNDSDFEVIHSKPSPFGPALLCYAPLKFLLGYDSEGFLVIRNNCICASVSYLEWMRTDNGMTYTDSVVLNRVSPRGMSCNPNSHYVIPDAPFLTALLQYGNAPTSKDDRVGGKPRSIASYATPDQGKLIYNKWNFSTNIDIDRYVSQCAIKPEVKFANTVAGLGEWTAEYISRMRRNLLIKETEREQWIQERRRITLPGDARQKDDSKIDQVGIADSGRTS